MKFPEEGQQKDSTELQSHIHILSNEVKSHVVSPAQTHGHLHLLLLTGSVCVCVRRVNELALPRAFMHNYKNEHNKFKKA